jgi:hypothetical protein
MFGDGAARPEPLGPRKRGHSSAEREREARRMTNVKVKCFMGCLLYPTGRWLFVDCCLKERNVEREKSKVGEIPSDGGTRSRTYGRRGTASRTLLEEN